MNPATIEHILQRHEDNFIDVFRKLQSHERAMIKLTRRLESHEELLKHTITNQSKRIAELRNDIDQHLVDPHGHQS